MSTKTIKYYFLSFEPVTDSGNSKSAGFDFEEGTAHILTAQRCFSKEAFHTPPEEGGPGTGENSGLPKT